MTPPPIDPAMPPPRPNLVIKTRDGEEYLAHAEDSGEFRREVEVALGYDHFVSFITAKNRLRTHVRASEIILLQENFGRPADTLPPISSPIPV